MTTTLSPAQAARLNEIRAVVRAAIEPSLVGYISTRWPNTYAADFLRGHPQLLPQSAGAELDTASRGSASAAIRAWAQALDVPADALKAVLADAYLEENHIPLREAAAQRDALNTDHGVSPDPAYTVSDLEDRIRRAREYLAFANGGEDVDKADAILAGEEP